MQTTAWRVRIRPDFYLPAVAEEYYKVAIRRRRDAQSDSQSLGHASRARVIYNDAAAVNARCTVKNAFSAASVGHHGRRKERDVSLHRRQTMADTPDDIISPGHTGLVRVGLPFFFFLLLLLLPPSRGPFIEVRFLAPRNFEESNIQR